MSIKHKLSQTKQFKLYPTTIGLILTAIAVYFLLSPNYAIKRLNMMVYDYQTKYLTNYPVKYKSDIIIIDIDDKSLKSIGQWPWSREQLAKLIDNAYRAGAVIIGLDIIFSEKQKNPITKLLAQKDLSSAVTNELKKIQNQYNGDKILSQAITKGDTVLSYVLLNQETHQQGKLPKPLISNNQNKWQKNVIPKMKGYITNIPIIQNAGTTSGFISYFRDQDGITRKLPLLLSYQNNVYSSFVLEILKTYLLTDNVHINTQVTISARLINSVNIGHYHIPTDFQGQVYIPFPKNQNKIKTVSALDVLNHKFTKALFDQKIVLIGTSAIGLADLRATPVNVALPGVHVQANVIQGILDQKLPARPSYFVSIELIILMLLGIILSILLPWLRPKWQIIISSASIISIFYFWYYVWISNNLIMHVTLIIGLIFSITILDILYAYIFIYSREKHLKSAFKQYIPPQQVDLLLKNQQNFSFSGKALNMTVLFCDICDFTTISEKLSPNKLKELLNIFFTHMTKIIFEQKGTIDKYVGDMVMAFWGAPMPNKNHAQDCLTAAMKMLEQLKFLNEILQKQNLPSIKIGIGIATGEMNVGDMGSKYRRNYTVIGDTVNLASRLESATRKYNVSILVNECVKNQCQDWEYCFIDEVKLKGKSIPVKVYQPMPKNKISD